MRILTMLTVLFFCGNIFAQNSARESAFGHVDMKLSAYQDNNMLRNVDRSDGDRAMALAALPRELAVTISTTEFIDSLKGLDTSDKIASQEDINAARAMAIYSPNVVREMIGLIPMEQDLSDQFAKTEGQSNT